MELYLYEAATKKVALEMKNALSYTDNAVVMEDGVVYAPLAEGYELSATPDCAGTLRAAWRRNNPPAEERMETLETLMAQLLYGGEAA